MRIFVASLIVFAVLYFWDKITTTANYWMGLTACDEPSPTICFIKEMSAGAESEEMRTATEFGMPKDPFIREKFTKLRTAARKLAAEYFERYPKDRYLTEVEGWRHLQSDNIEFTIKRLREPIDSDNHRG